jgi:dihydroorotate dehydrogenase (NAD+) catalytic subunit
MGAFMSLDLTTNIGRLKINNPIMVASGTYGYGEEFEKLYSIKDLGAIVTKGISLRPRKGNDMPRIVETPSGMLNAIGLQNVGVKEFVAKKLPFMQEAGATVIVNIFGSTLEEYIAVAKTLEKAKGIDGLELNISCPNVKKGGIEFGCNPEMASKLVTAVREITQLPLMVKLSPSAPSIPEISQAIAGAGADSLSVINTIPAMVIDPKKRKPVLANEIGGLSGPAIRPIAVRMVWEAAQAVKIPVIGIGGIMNLNDALEFFIAGAAAVQIGTANFVDPYVAPRLLSELEEYLKTNKMTSFSELVGSLQHP